MIKRIAIIILFLLPFGALSAPNAKDTLSRAIRMIQRGDNDSLRFAANAFLTDTLLKVITTDTNFTASFTAFNNVALVTDPEKKVRLFTWIVPHYSGEKYSYFGYAQIRDPKKKVFLTIELKDKTDSIEKAESAKLNAANWLGALYYTMIPVEVNNKTVYTLIGWKGKNNSTTQKILESLSIEKNQPVFGKPIFKTDGGVYKNRLLYSFVSQASMALRYEEKNNRIVVEHIGGNSIATSGPDGTYDAFIWKKGKWLLKQNVDVDAGIRKPEEVKPVKDDGLFKK